MNKLFNFPSNLQVNVAPFGTPEGIPQNYNSKGNSKKSPNSSGNNSTGNRSNSKSSSGSNGRSNNFNGSPSNVASGCNNTKSANGTNGRSQKNRKWSNSRFINSLRTTLETLSQEENQSNWRTHSRFLQCESRSPQSSFRNEPQNSQKDQESQLVTEERSIQWHPTSIRPGSNGLIPISPEPSNDQLLDHKDECPPTRLESMETMPSVSTTNTATFGIGEEFLKFDAYVDITDIPDLEISNVVSDDSCSGSSTLNSPISPRAGYIPGTTNKEVDTINSNSNSTTLEARDYSTFQSHVRSIISTQKAALGNPTLKVYDSSYAKFYSFCTSNNLDPSDITLVVFMDYLTYLFKLVPSLAYSTINGHRSRLNQLLHLYNKSDIVNDPFIARLMAGIHKLRPASAKYNEIWDANLEFKYLSKIDVLPKFTYSTLLHKTLVLCEMFG
ncbi:hypothetical protein ACTA71_011187 [Dictyostelium dimigraforme]